MTTSKIAVLGLALSTLTIAGCFGTEGGNPLDVDGGPSGPDSSVECGADGGVPVRPTPLCESGGEPLGDCTCFAGAPVSFSQTTEGLGQRTALYGPTPSGGAAAVHARICAEDCSDTRRATLEVRRFDAAGAAVGAPIEVTRSSAWVEHGATLVDDTLALVFADERAGPSGSSDLFFGRLDLTTGAWIVEPRLALATASPVTGVRLARTSAGYGLVFAQSGDAGSDPLASGVFFLRLGEDGVAVGAPARVAGADGFDASAMALAPRGDGYLLGRWTATSLELVPLSADGAESGPGSVIPSANAAGAAGPIVRTSGTGYLLAWSDAAGLRVGRTDGAGALVGTPTEVADGTLRAMVEQADGTVALLWIPRVRCAEPFVEAQERVLTRLGPSGERRHPDVLVHRGTGQSFGGALVDTASGLRASFVTYGPEESTAWMVAACAP